MEVEAEATTVAEVSVAIAFEDTTSEVIALGETAFREVDLIRSATYAESQDAGQQNTPLTRESKRTTSLASRLRVSTENLQLYTTRAF